MEENEKIRQFLSDVYSIEQQALAQLRSAPKAAGEPALAQHLEVHLRETERQAERVKDRLEATGGAPSKLKDAVMRVGGKGFLLFATAQPDTPGKLAAHAYAYEALELAAYDLLARTARAAGDEATERLAMEIREEERAMRDRLESDLEATAYASLDASGRTAQDALPHYLADAHALEAQAVELLKRAPELAGHPEVAHLYEDHLAESAEHARLIDDRLESMGKGASTFKDAALSAGAINWSLFFRAQEDTPAKLAAFVYAFEHLEVAGYEQLKRVAQRAGDDAAVGIAERVLRDERTMAKRVFDAFDLALEPTLAASRRA